MTFLGQETTFKTFTKAVLRKSTLVVEFLITNYLPSPMQGLDPRLIRWMGCDSWGLIVSFLPILP